jgi:hypothetical protein
MEMQRRYAKEQRDIKVIWCLRNRENRAMEREDTRRKMRLEGEQQDIALRAEMEEQHRIALRAEMKEKKKERIEEMWEKRAMEGEDSRIGREKRLHVPPLVPLTGPEIRALQVRILVENRSCSLIGTRWYETPIGPNLQHGGFGYKRQAGALPYHVMYPHHRYGFPFGEDEHTRAGVEYVHTYAPDWVSRVARPALPPSHSPVGMKRKRFTGRVRELDM